MKELKSGTDIRGTALGENPTLTPERAALLAKAFVWFLEEKGVSAPRIALGRDPRLSGPALGAAVAKGLTEMGAEVLDCGLATTPSMFFATYYPGSDCDGAIEITASHLPFDRNGLKFFTKAGGIDGGDVSALIERAEQGDFPARKAGAQRPFDLMGPYGESLVTLVRERTGAEKPLEGVKVAVDAGNGAGGFFVERVLQPLGADTAASVYLEPDGSFPNHIPNPESAAAMGACAKAVTEGGADIGICFDTDCDRAAIVDGSGLEVNRNRMIAMVAALMLKEQPGCTIVTDSVTSRELTAFIEEKGGVHHRFMRGYKKVIDEAKRIEAEGGSAPLAMETSGHGALKENHYLDDGSYLAARLLAELALLKKQGKTLLSLIEGLGEPAESLELRVQITEPDFRSCGERMLKALKQRFSEKGWEEVTPNYEGVRFNFPGGWVLARMSLHDPVLPINIESKEPGAAAAVQAELRDFLGRFSTLTLPMDKKISKE